MLTTKTLTKKFEKDKSKVLHGLYDEATNTIYLGKDLPEDVKLHVLMHELSHMLHDSFQRLEGEEAVADLLGAYLMKISGCKTAEELIERLRVK